MDYLLKVTAIWALFLLLFEALYKRNRKFGANRAYLLSAILLGLLLPLIPQPSGIPELMPATPAALFSDPAPVQQADNPLAPAAITTAAQTPDLALLMGIAYGLGVLVLCSKFLVELYSILVLIRRNPVHIIHRHKVMVTGKLHGPYSFIGLIFISNPDIYTTRELEYIIQHEAAHNTRKHWADLWFIQLACMAFWFHPLIWRYRYLLQLQQEYEADAIAANDDPYAYGHFLLQQTLLKGTPSFVHSFHASPIKNRIHMLSQKPHVTGSDRKYLLLIPALIVCTFLMTKAAAKTERALKPNETAFNGNIFSWRDTAVTDETPATSLPAGNKAKRQVITGMNGEPVYTNESLKQPASFGTDNMSYVGYINKELRMLTKNTPDSLTAVGISNLVIDKAGKVVYYDVQYYRPYAQHQENLKYLYPFAKPEPVLNALVDKIIKEGPDWETAKINGKPANSLVSFAAGGC